MHKHQKKYKLENFINNEIFAKILLDFFFFFFGQITKNFIKKKQPTQVHWGCTVGAKIKNQNYNNQVKQQGKQEICDKPTLHTRRV